MSERAFVMTQCRVLSGNTLLGQLLETFLASENRGSLPVTVILDAPWGYAVKAFETELKHAATLVATDNPCGEYWDDLWDLGPTVLVARELPPANCSRLSTAQQRAKG